ncbi:uncharacterized protein Dwil_GK16702 [Drosophila willistoni]|uniref:Uncharacterized protein n=1 Tax=Drosophila willistoni TaxID=7260 RepID=B4ML89_DROWI|nr:DNA repair protein SWI5 homolog [Drosophila willistoni]EDW73347.1 uncharacterized protein Dwil_GK16702 [Drosophila willistoni]
MDNTKEAAQDDPKRKSDQKRLIQLMHEYNNLKDATQIVLAALAQSNGVSLKSMHKKYNLPIGE